MNHQIHRTGRYNADTLDPASVGRDQTSDFVLNLTEFWQLIYRGGWIIATCALIGGLIAVYSVLQITPTYAARAQILLGQESRADDALGNLFQGLDLDSKLIAGEVAIMSSGRILTRVSEKLQLGNLPEFNSELRPEDDGPTIIDRAIDGLKAGLKTVMGADNPTSPDTLDTAGTGDANAIDPVATAALAEQATLGAQADFVGGLETGLVIRQVGSSPLVDIGFFSTDPAVAAAVANTVADEYISFQLEEKLTSARRVTEGLNSRIIGLRERLEESEREVIEFRDRMLGTDLGGSERLEQQIRELSSRLVEVSTAHAELKAELSEVDRMVEEGDVLSTTVVLDSTLIQELQSQLSDLRRREIQLQQRFGNDNPRLSTVAEEIGQTEDALAVELQRQRNELQGRTSVAQARERSIRQQLRNMEQRYVTLSQEMILLTQLEREADANRMVYETFLTTFTQTNEVVGLQVADARVVSYAKPPTSPAAPNKKVSVALGVIAGLLAGLGLVFLRALRVDSIDSPEKLRRLMGIVPVVTTMPIIKRLFRRADPLLSPGSKNNAQLTEAVRLLRNTLMLQPISSNWKIAIISAESGEGKTTTSLLLAQAFAQSGKSCVVVETDLRRASIANVLDQPARPDVIDVLAGKTGLYNALRYDKKTGAHILPARSGVADPAGLLMSDNMRVLIEELEKDFDLILFDTPPLLSVSDALPVLRYADDVIMVVRWKRSTVEKVSKCLNMLREAKVSLTCSVMTMTKGRKYNSYDTYYNSETSDP